LTALITIINRGILINDINFTIKINIINNFIKNHAPFLKDNDNETDVVLIWSTTFCRKEMGYNVLCSHWNKFH